MAASIHIVARFRANAEKEEALKAVLLALVVPTRGELGCYRYDLLQSSTDPREFCIIERWDTEKSLEQHMGSTHLKKALADASELTDGPPEGRRYVLL